MSRFLLLIVVLLTVAVGCAPSESYWKVQAGTAFDAARLEGAEELFPAEYGSLASVLELGEAFLYDNDSASAEDYFRFAWLKAGLLEKNVLGEKQRRAEEELRRSKQLIAQERQRIALAEERKVKRQGASQKRTEKNGQHKERVLRAFHTVKRGETLPQIAAQPDVYNDFRLWPLLYRSNRDQVSDPRLIWPGQILRIPRNNTRDEISEARRYAAGKATH